ncbi:Diaminohydroxyphosphoribosylaminopyrimidine deaminase / 5-amino-6-(5-phosphoribosylamino)uracil reductase [hydrothermal vent metagenome]|uniref:Diaminohydroxyphosphoribosylaminopyrimidine deaminase / 5-amino-6-(5-phosphoribosylamino)uracil reductase n=1 Tax=hydrothermal vent metagenome TaxID=652676 RepID=A0A3B1DH45_9ZZZZ
MSVRTYLDRAACVATRATGDVEPNPMVGAVLVREGVVIGLGHHRRYGGLHAEREALANCRRRGNDPRGATAFVTLEPCCHHGKQPPCTEALIEAGIERVVYARPDPHAASGGGAEVLQQAGIPCEFCTDSPLATHLSDPFVKRVTTGLPWVIAKWAQTAGGSLTTPEGESPWITNALSLKRVHRLRARVDAIVTGIGTVIADDPLLTARGVRRVRRIARRVVVEGQRTLPLACQLVRSVDDGAVVVVRAFPNGTASEKSPSRKRGEAGPCARLDASDPSLARGAQWGIKRMCVPGVEGRIDLAAMLCQLVEQHDATTVMLECGPRLLGAFFEAGLVDEAFVYGAPDAQGHAQQEGLRGKPARWVEALPLVRTKVLGGDVEYWYRRLFSDG